MCKCATRIIYRLGAGSPGVRNREWHDTQPAIPIAASTTAAGRAFRLGHDFSLATTVDATITTLDLNDTDNTAGELDVQVLDTVITVPAGGLWVEYRGGSEGYWAIEVGQCCGPFELRDELGYQDREDASSVVGPVFLPEGQHNFRAWNIDSGGTNSSHQIWYSLDGTDYSRTQPDDVTLTLDKRPVECFEIPACQTIPEGWDKCPPSPCAGGPVDPAPSTAVNLATTLPVPDNEVDDQIRSGQIGTSLEAARADHNHEIVPQSNPGDIVPTVGGSMTLVGGPVYLDRWAEEESFEWEIRQRVTLPAGTSWGYLVIPVLAGWSQPKITPIGMYRINSTSIQQDDGAFGASPRGPEMDGSALFHWSSTRRLYYRLLRRDNPVDGYAIFRAQYVRLP